MTYTAMSQTERERPGSKKSSRRIKDAPTDAPGAGPANGGASNAENLAGPEYIRVMVVDDHPAIREALADTVGGRPDMKLCGSVATAQEAMQQAAQEEPDVIVIDISLRDAHGLDLVRRLHSQNTEAQMVIFSVYDENLYAERAIQAGALAYVMKSEPTTSVVEAIRSVHQGNVYVSQRMAAQILGKVVRQQRHSLGATIDELTDRETAVFHMLGEGMGVRSIAEELGLSRKTVETYRRRAKEKLGFDSVSELLQYAVQWTCGKEHMK